MDEKGFCGDSSMRGNIVIAPKYLKHVNQIVKPTFNKHFTVVAIVCANGTSIPPVIILEGQSINIDTVTKQWDGIKLSAQSNGYNTQQHFPGIIEHLNSKIDENLKPILLILDGSTTHYDGEALKQAKTNGIEILCLPPNTTHRLQPLDRSCFKSFSSAYKNQCEIFRFINKRGIKKKDLLLTVKKAWDKSITQKNIRSGFKSCGIWPLNRSAIDKNEFKPSINITQNIFIQNNNNCINTNSNNNSNNNNNNTTNVNTNNNPLTYDELLRKTEELQRIIDQNNEKQQQKKRNTMNFSFKTKGALMLTEQEIIDQIMNNQKRKQEAEEKKKEKQEEKKSKKKKLEADKENICPNVVSSISNSNIPPYTLIKANHNSIKLRLAR